MARKKEQKVHEKQMIAKTALQELSMSPEEVPKTLEIKNESKDP